MADLTAQRIEVAKTVWRDLAIENQLTRDQARAFVRGLQTSWQVRTIAWQDRESQEQLDDARRLLHAAQLLRRLEGPESPEAVECYRRAAEILEWLARAGDPLRTLAPIDLFAAAAYQLGGLPAMSRGLLMQLELSDPGSRMYGAFLQADFDTVVKQCARFWKANVTLTTRSGSVALLEDGAGDRLEWFFTAELVRALGLFAHAVRRNDTERIGRALTKLQALNGLAARTFSEDVAVLISLLEEVASGFSAASIYHPLRQLGDANPSKRARLNRYGRDQFSRGRGILWRPQQQGLNRLMTSDSFALCTPTGSGKTLVAIMALLKELVVPEDDGIAPLALYVVPSRALAGEVEAKLKSELGNDLTVTGLYGGTDWGITDHWLTSDDPTVLIATVEKADALLRYVGPLIVSRLKLLILDEAHQVVVEDSERTKRGFAEHSNRAIRIESFVSRLLARSPEVARIALTAVAGGAAGPVARWMERSDDASAIGTHYRSTRQVVGAIEFHPDRPSQITVDMVNGQGISVRGRDAPVYIPLRIPVMPTLPAAMRNSIYRFNALSVLWAALHLVGDDRRVLISVAQGPEQMMRWFKEALELPTWAGINPFVTPIHGDSGARFQRAQAACADYCGLDSFESILLAQGIATSHGQMPQRLRRLMTELIEHRVCPITLATATLTEGVNLPFDLIFLTSLKRRTFDATTQQQIIAPMSLAEFQNLAGRAGRPGAAKGLEGMTLVALPMRPSATARGTIPKQRAQLGALETEYIALLRQLADNEGEAAEVQSPLALLLQTIRNLAIPLAGFDEERFLAWLEKVAPDDISDNAGQGLPDSENRLADSVDELDSFILSAVEELRILSQTDLDRAQIEQHLQTIWRSSFARVAIQQVAWLERALQLRGRAVTEHVYPDADERRRLYQYGFSPHIGRRFASVAPRIEEILSGCAGYAAGDDDERLAVFEAIADLIAEEAGFGFGIGSQSDQWQPILAWWMNVPDAQGPLPEDLRSWQRFVSDNFEFRMGVALGAVVAQVWNAGAESSLQVPTLAEWKETTELPWFAFWARELLRWGTLEPFVAFAMAQGIAGTRQEASELHREFRTWLALNHIPIEDDDWIDPQKFLAWQRSRDQSDDEATPRLVVAARMPQGGEPRREKYSVVPVFREGTISWIDPAGFELAVSPRPFDRQVERAINTASDFELRKDQRSGSWSVRRAFRAPRAASQ